MKKIRYTVKGMSCAACVAHVERAAASIVGEDARAVNLLTGSLTVTLPDGADEKKTFLALRAALKAAGYDLTDETDARASADAEAKRAVKKLIASLILTLILMVVAMGEMIGLPSPAIFERDPILFALVQLALTIPVILLNFRFFRGGFSALAHRAPNMDSLIAIGSTAALLWGLWAIGAMAIAHQTGDAETLHRYHHNLYFESAAMILALVSLGKTLESRAKARAADAVGTLASMMPDTARAERDGTLVEIPLSELAVGEILLVREGETIPADGIVVDGFGAVDESAISGESIPVDKELNSPVTGVCTLVSGHLKIRVTRVGEDTALSRILRLIEDASATKAPIARIADRVSAIFVPAVLGISLLTAALWMLLTRDLTRAIECAISVLVISCPCALGLATPTAITVGISRGASMGILIRSAEALERLGSVDWLLTDKTGTLTEGRPVLSEISAFGVDEDELLRLCASAESGSTHPLAGAIVRTAEERGLALETPKSYTSFGGKGIAAVLNESTCLVGSEELLAEHRISLSNEMQDALRRLCEQGTTTVCVAVNGIAIGVLALSDEARADSADAMRELQGLGVSAVMLTGDHERAARRIADTVGIPPEHVHARLLPEEKEAAIRDYRTRGACAMVGDGINDAPALAAADVGIAIGAGTEVAIDSADVVLTKNSLSDAVTAIKLSRATMRTVKQNLFWALFYNAICIPIAAGALYPALGITLTPMIGSAAMSVSSLFVVFNSLRLRRVSLDHHFKKQSTKENQSMFGIKKQENEITFGVEGMMCKNCKAHVEKALLSVKGVSSAEADLETKSVKVVAKSSVTEDSLKAAVTAAGYKVN